MKQPFFIGIGGASCSGKSTLADHLARTFEIHSASVISLDSYYRDLSFLPEAERADQNFDVPEALDWELFQRNLEALRRGMAIEEPIYHFKSHTRAAKVERVDPADVIIVEGIFALYREDIRKRFSLKVFVDASEADLAQRRIFRDTTSERGRSKGYVAEQYNRTVRPMCRRYVLPTRRYADLVVNGSGPIEEAGAAIRRHSLF